jgi:hypothetical protein
MLTFEGAFADVQAELAAPSPPLTTFTEEDEHHSSVEESDDHQNMPTSNAAPKIDHPVGLNEARDYVVQCDGGSPCNLADSTTRRPIVS